MNKPFQQERPGEELLCRRYRLEERIMAAVTAGDSREAEECLAEMARLAPPAYTVVPLRNCQNYVLGLDAMCKAAAAKVRDVHPAYIEQVYALYVFRVEKMTDPAETKPLVRRMVEEYCECVSAHRLEGYSPQIQRILHYIQLHPAQAMSLKFFAGMCNISASYLSSLFRTETGMTLTEYINRCRVDRAAVLLRLTDNTIAAVGERVGFLDENYFTRVFKRIKGMPPSAYRRCPTGEPESAWDKISSKGMEKRAESYEQKGNGEHSETNAGGR